MTTRLLRGCVLAAMIVLTLATSQVPAHAAGDDPSPSKIVAGDLKGSWLGTINVGPIKLRLGFVIQAAKGETIAAKLFSIDQGNSAIDVDAVEVQDDQVSLIVKPIGGSFAGTWNPETKEIAGEWKQGGQAFPLTLARVDVLPGALRPQDPQEPYPYLEEEVSFTNRKHDVTLNGTLTRPKGEGPFAAVVLISGSGPQDRDESLLGHRPFLVLADALTRRGIAVLRFDDRDFDQPSAAFEATSEELSQDVLAGVELLRARPEIDAARIGLLGHSEGGLIAPMLAAKERGIAFIVMIAGPGLPGDQILQMQAERLLRHSGVDDDTLQQELARSRRTHEILQTEPDNEAALTKIAELFQDSIAASGEEERAAAEAMFDRQAKLLITPWFRYLIAYDPRHALTQVACPVLAVIGEKDSQVPPRENLPIIKAALEEGGNQDFVVRELAGLNHLLQPCESGMVDEYATIETTIDPDALDLIGDWIVSHAGAAP